MVQVAQLGGRGIILSLHRFPENWWVYIQTHDCASCIDTLVCRYTPEQSMADFLTSYCTFANLANELNITSYIRFGPIPSCIRWQSHHPLSLL